jgi:putative acetyltransferase
MNVSAPVRIRAYESSDLDAVILISRGRSGKSLRAITTPTRSRHGRRPTAKHGRAAGSNRPTWVAVIGDTLAGFGDLQADGLIDMMLVHPGHQARGVASALLARIETAALELELPALFTEASITARPFFEARGFRVVRSQVAEVRGQCLVNFLMEKSLH